MIKITQPWPTKDGRWFLPHFGLPNLQARVLKLLGCEPTPESVAKAVAKWDALDLEAAIDEARVCGGMVRSQCRMAATPHGQVLAAKPIVEIIKIGDSEPEPLPEGDRPLSGIRALDLTRILAGPDRRAHAGGERRRRADGHRRAPAADPRARHRHEPRQTELLSRSQSRRGRGPAEGAGARRRRVLAGLPPRHHAKLGFAPEVLAAIRPGIVCCSISCFGADGPFSHRGGWEQVAQTVTGICKEGSPERPALLPARGLRLHHRLSRRLRHAAGARPPRARRRQLPRPRLALPVRHVHLPPGQDRRFRAEHRPVGPSSTRPDQVQPAAGPLRHLGPMLQLSETPPRWSRPTPVLGGDAPEWPDPAAAQAAE